MAPSSYLAMAAFTANTVLRRSRKSTYGLPRRNAAWAMQAVSSGTGGRFRARIPAWQHGAFTKMLLDALSDPARSGWVG
jgi:hypothetical protein